MIILSPNNEAFELNLVCIKKDRMDVKVNMNDLYLLLYVDGFVTKIFSLVTYFYSYLRLLRKDYQNKLVI